ncbi:MAG TPA: glycosyltransferase [Vicinamibacterales bacterium]|nr:glycosyltransferase [Vicinamibacterales bacterium]
MNWPRYVVKAAGLAFNALREGRLPASPRRWLVDLRHLHAVMTDGPMAGVIAQVRTASESNASAVEPRRPDAIPLTALLNSDARLRFASVPEPRVSVLLVLFNRAELTLRCLRSLLEIASPSFEVICVDNQSSDQTTQLLNRLDGVRIIRMPQNVGFLRGCAAAAAVARGKYLLFLNNDTELLPGGLEAAVETLDHSPTIGAVGGQLVWPDGRLQEAGAIVWADGSCQAYGRGESPWAPEYAFTRDVDYCSAALLMTPRSLFAEMGGFDDRFAPAYYEDVDYCVRLWQRGLRVVYEPRFGAIHVEFASAPSADAALTAQAEHHARFVEKHRDWLRTRHQRAPGAVLRARSAGPASQRLLFVEDRVPLTRLGSGYPRSLAIIRAAIELGYQVTLYPLVVPDESWDDAYREVPRGVELMLQAGADGLRSFLESRLADFDIVLVSRPHNMHAFRAALSASKVTRVPALVYDAEALFAAREIGRQLARGTPLGQTESEQLVNAELALARNSEVVLTVSEIERRRFAERGFPKVIIVGNSLTPSPGMRPFGDRDGILFVGAMGDDASPNTDAVYWFWSEILGPVRQHLRRDVPFTVVGRNSSTRLKPLDADRSISLAGIVDDVAPLFGQARVFVAPTRYAAGIPLKIQEAAAFGVPVVCTPLLAEQLGWCHDVELLVASDAQSFAGCCRDLHENAALWTRIRQAALARVQRECAPEAFRGALESALRLAARPT